METKTFLNHTVSRVVGCRETKGDKFGIELELEGRGVMMPDVATRGWNRHNDGSLRGESVEYTTTGAKDFNETKKSVDDLFKKFKDHKVNIKNSIRTSTHVHLNFSDKTVKQMLNFFTLFTMFEEVLQYYSGEDRKGNLFCISSREAEGIVHILGNAVAKGDLSLFAGDKFKYAACNLSSLYKFGTVEIRTMKGADSAEQVNAWVSILNDMYEYACNKMVSPAALVNDLSMLGAEGLMRAVFKPENVRELMRYFPVPATLHFSLMEGARLLQIFAYNFEEDFNAKVEIKKEKDHNRLPCLIQEGGWRGNWYGIYNSLGRQMWALTGDLRMEGFWVHGEAVRDNPGITWDAELGRFVYTNPVTKRKTPLNWWKHHLIGDEGPPRHLRMEEDDEAEDEDRWWDDERFEPVRDPDEGEEV